jgi:hypothetical protein
VTRLNEIALELNTQTADIRAEVLLSQSMATGLQQKEFILQPDGFFYRSYVGDLYTVNVDEQTGFQNHLNVHLSRPGLYDALPEGLFFQTAAHTPIAKTAGEMAEESRMNKKKEKDIRKFFAPFENEFFLHALQNEATETDLLQGLRSGWLKEYFIDFWELPKGIPAAAGLALVMFLPYAHSIAGNMEAMAGVLQKIINEPVMLDFRYPDSTDADAASNGLSEHALGSHLICGESFAEQYPVLSFTIGPLQKSKAYQFINGGNYFPVLQTFYNYFIPAHAEVKTTVLLKKGADAFILNHEEDIPLLGISSVL